MEEENGRRFLKRSLPGMVMVQQESLRFPPCFYANLTIFVHIHFTSVDRTTIQVKTHGQVVVAKIDKGENVFAELDRLERFAASKEERVSPSSAAKGPVSVSANFTAEDVEAANTLFSMRK